MKHKQKRILCQKCGGTGMIDLPSGLEETLRFVTAAKCIGVTAGAIQKGTANGQSFHVSAFNNRLNTLVEMGFIRRERSGRSWLYFASQPKTSQSTKPKNK